MAPRHRRTLTANSDLNSHENAEHRGSVFACVRGCSVVWRPQTDRSGREKGPQRDAAVREWMSDNHGYGRES
jgi:hypothetical protein